MNKKDLIRVTAIKLIAQDGYYNTKIQDIADNANIAVGTIYHYYKNKQEIFDYIFSVIFNEFFEFVSELEQSNNDSLNMIDSYIRFHIKEWEKNPDIFNILQQDGIPFSKQSFNFREMYKKSMKKLENIIKQGQKTGEIKEIDAGMIAYLISNFMRIIKFDLTFECDYETRKEQFISFLINSLKK
jgi:TetR/AcrR family fatty acid metabolism transcriptional regulator